MTRNDPAAAGTDGASETLGMFLAAVPAAQRGRVRVLLTDPHCGGRGLRALLARLDTDRRPLPDALPTELVEVYLRDDEAEPLHDCERCGLPVPVRAGRRCGHEASVDREYFPTCPRCGGRTGRHAFWSRRPQ
ncbi:hypothetical protein GobsT_26290 [Gemmata obscuriglobus]|uniref:hypothetical protein n=1 Tax=Gemmata obscuriglobus TaxID=114 RepID=UPI00016C4D92|nr:hypothetical protein [Gemmata obscuriglobus]QEG27865.1 hypothetical protein GobsT_26290 [Gemmata obscuriglobus]VTS05256.1 Uncharacterized protein OS=Nitrolancea hollandica Lb GN=NITHO_2500006 PE=4 SV=1 [Gemmata obscuriglobus UQM 2246]